VQTDRHYRLYQLSSDGQIASARDVFCATDQDAQGAATALCYPGLAMEIWQKARLVGTVRSPNPAHSEVGDRHGARDLSRSR